MANSKSAEKRVRQDTVRRERNRSGKSVMRTSIKKLRTTIEAGDAAKAREQLPETLRLVDMTAQKGGIHANAAARTKSRLTCAVQNLS
ncbi:MAG: 30S ribosomal protein S20 [Acidobacteriota bacterium]|nr:30S ribosomal protein S20 [Acidobacteriota bacterium]